MADGRNWRKSMVEIQIYVEGGGDEKKVSYCDRLFRRITNISG